MSKINSDHHERISQEVLRILYEHNLTPLTTKFIADELIRDDEYVLKILKELKKHGIVKTAPGYSRRKYWSMTSEAYSEYKKLL